MERVDLAKRLDGFVDGFLRVYWDGVYEDRGMAFPQNPGYRHHFVTGDFGAFVSLLVDGVMGVLDGEGEE